MTAKSQRQQMIGYWLREHKVGSQEELVARLGLAGIAATQATVSRDLDELKAVKVRRDGAIRYVPPNEVDSGHGAAMLDRLLAEWVTDIIEAEHLVVIKTPPGSANLVANALDAAAIDGVAGTIAGDDTIFVALSEGTSAGILAARLRTRRVAG
ncbi:arginine repressor [Sphingomonas sp.]|uniref:arginine repressor n=1 Tax=Sphingomonas sp. TaxID=28214 RepID=UPI00286D25C7|nr:arginine repressor [Sphingomonas sp.]